MVLNLCLLSLIVSNSLEFYLIIPHCLVVYPIISNLQPLDSNFIKFVSMHVSYLFLLQLDPLKVILQNSRLPRPIVSNSHINNNKRICTNSTYTVSNYFNFNIIVVIIVDIDNQ